MAYTESEKCLPDKETVKEMAKAGYKFFKDGKLWKGDKDGKL